MPYDVMAAWNAVVMPRYMMLALDYVWKRSLADWEDLFFEIYDELPCIT